MPQEKKSGRSSNGTGSIRKKTTKRNGKTYCSRQGRYTVGYDPVSGKQIQGSISSKSRDEVAKKLRQITAKIDTCTYIIPSKMTVGEWVELWLKEYCVDVRPSTAYVYKRNLELHVIPQIGSLRLEQLTPQIIQRTYNELSQPTDSAKNRWHLRA